MSEALSGNWVTIVQASETRRVSVADPAERPGPAPAAARLAAGRRPKLLFLATEDWYFWSDRLPAARAAREAGFEVVVAARVTGHGERIRAERFALRPLAWRRRGDGPIGGLRAFFAIVRLYRAERPGMVNHLALKAVLFGGLARHLAFPSRQRAPVTVDWIMGLGSGFAGVGLAARLRRHLLGWVLRLATAGAKGPVVVQNPEDGSALAGFGIDPRRIVLIRGSGVDTRRFAPLPEPSTEGQGISVALVGRMLRDKGVLDAVAAVQRLRARGLPVSLLLAGTADPDNPGSLSLETLAALGREPGIEWLGRVEDVREVWRRAAIAVLPSSYGEGLPRALLEAAACARPIVATDIPGCREAVRHAENGLLVAPHDIEGLAEAIAALAGDPARRRAMGRAGRALVEREFAEEIIVRGTLALYRAALQQRGDGR